MQTIKSYFHKLLSFLRVRSVAGGLEISDQVLRLVYYNGRVWQMAAVRLAVGVMDKGNIRDEPALIAALRELKMKVPVARDKKKMMNVIVSLSSVQIYNQVFAVPAIEGPDLDKAVELNAQMLSPIDINQAYIGWEFLGKDETGLKSEVAAAFANKAVVDAITQALFAAGFITVGVESRALAFVRILREKGAGVDIDKAYLVLNIDNSGIDFLVVRKGRLYFEYATQWSDIADEKGQVSVEKFSETLESSLRQVMNFYTQRWPEPLAAVILSAVAFEKEAEAAVVKSASLPVIRLSLFMGQSISSEWLVALGCSLRTINPTIKDKEINLLGEEAMDTFRKEQLVYFMSLWRVLIPTVLAFLIVIFALADNFLSVTKASIESQPAFSQRENNALDAFEASSTSFNDLVALVADAEGQINDNYRMIADISNSAAANGVTITQLSFQGSGTAILVVGASPAESQIIAFKNAVQNDPHFSTFTLPLSNIQQNNQGYTFSMQFPLGATPF